MKIVRIIGYVIGFGLLAFGAWFLIAPEAALAETSHRLDTLPYVMGGRYAFFGAMLIGALYHGDPSVTAYLLAGLQGSDSSTRSFMRLLILGHISSSGF